MSGGNNQKKMETIEKIFNDYFNKSPCDAALLFLSKDKKYLVDECSTWLSDLEIAEGRQNERVKIELDGKIETLYSTMLDAISEEVDRVYMVYSFEDFVNQYFEFRSEEYIISKQLIHIHENDKENFAKVGQYAKDNKELFIQLLKALE